MIKPDCREGRIKPEKCSIFQIFDGQIWQICLLYIQTAPFHLSNSKYCLKYKKSIKLQNFKTNFHQSPNFKPLPPQTSGLSLKLHFQPVMTKVWSAKILFVIIPLRNVTKENH